MQRLKKILENSFKFGDQFSNMDIAGRTMLNARMLAEDSIRELLLNSADAAIEATPEFQYAPLRDRLIENLSHWEHYHISSNLSSVKIFDEAHAGTASDLTAGQLAGGGSRTAPQKLRLFCWKFGIYIPSREGGTAPFKQFKDYPSYQEVINKRLAAWGDKAPYWYFLEWGNAGGSPAYPSFAGTGFIARVLGQVPGIISNALDDTVAEMQYGLDEAIREFLSNPEQETRAELGYIPVATVAETKYGVSVRTKKSGELYYMLRINGRFARAVSPGEIVPEMGRRFTP